MQRRQGDIPSSAFSTALAVTVDTARDALFVVDSGGVRRVNADGTAQKIKLQGAARLAEVEACCVDKDGHLYLTQKNNHGIYKIHIVGDTGVMYRLAGRDRLYGYVDSSWWAGFRKRMKACCRCQCKKNKLADGAMEHADIQGLFQQPRGMCTDGAGNLLVADYGNHVIRMVTPRGQVSTFAGVPPPKSNLKKLLKKRTVQPKVVDLTEKEEAALRRTRLETLTKGGVKDTAWALESTSKASIVLTHPTDVTRGGPDNAIYVIDGTWSVRKILASGCVVVVALAGYHETQMCQPSAVGDKLSAIKGDIGPGFNYPPAEQPAASTGRRMSRMSIALAGRASVVGSRRMSVAGSRRMSVAGSRRMSVASSVGGRSSMAGRSRLARRRSSRLTADSSSSSDDSKEDERAAAPKKKKAPKQPTVAVLPMAANKATRGMPPRSDVGRKFVAPFVRTLKDPRALAVDAYGHLFVAVVLPAAMGVSWLSSDVVPPGVHYAGIRVLNPYYTGGLAKASTIVEGSGPAGLITSVGLDSHGFAYWARGGVTVLPSDPWPQWRRFSGFFMLRFLFLAKRARAELVANRRVTSRHRAGLRAMQWLITVPAHHTRVFRRVFEFL